MTLGPRDLLGAGVSLRVLGRAGLVEAHRPSVLLGMGQVLRQWGVGPAGGFATMALRSPDEPAVIDEDGSTTWAQMHRRGNAIARGLAGLGLTHQDRVGLLCRNHRGFLDALCGTSRLGATVVFLNTSMAAPQLEEVARREGLTLLVHDEEFRDVVHAVQAGLASTGGEVGAVLSEPGQGTSLPEFAATQDASDLTPPPHGSRLVILTSGTTGTPKGAPRSEAGLGAAVALLSRMPLKVGWRTHIAAPLFHTWGLAHLLLSLLLGSTMVLRRRFEPAECLQVVADERCESLVVIPVMLQRILALAEMRTEHLELSALRVVASSGSALPGDLATRWMDRFGENLHSIYGSTEVAYAAVATPEDLRADPTTAGRAPARTVLRILDESDREVAPGESGRIFVGNSLLMPGYTTGENKQMVAGLMCSGDVGRFDEHGRLVIEGRDDDMVVCGGENVFPSEVENCLARHPEVLEVAVLGVPDEEFGTRLRAFVARTEEAGAAPEAALTEDLKDWVRTRLARYKVPREVVLLDELPRNATGKILKRSLADWPG